MSTHLEVMHCDYFLLPQNFRGFGLFRDVLGAFSGRLGALLGLLWSFLGPLGGILVSPAFSAGLVITRHPVGPFLVLNKRVCEGNGGHRALLALKRPLGDISARGAGGIRYWGLLGRSWGLLGRSWGDLGWSWESLRRAWGGPGAVLGDLGAVLEPSCGDVGPSWPGLGPS